MHISVAVKRDHCCAALQYTFEPCGFYFGRLTPAVYQIYLSSVDLTNHLGLLHYPGCCQRKTLPAVEIQECNSSTVQLHLLQNSAFTLVYCHSTHMYFRLCSQLPSGRNGFMHIFFPRMQTLILYPCLLHNFSITKAGIYGKPQQFKYGISWC